MNTKAIGAIIAFTALTAALNLIRIPAPYLLTHSYQLGDIAIIIAFLLFGIKIGVTTATLNMVISMTIATNPGGIIGGLYYFISILAMLSGIYIFERVFKRKRLQHTIHKSAIISTLFGVVSRTLIMLPLDYFLFGYLVYLLNINMSLSECYAIVLAVIPNMIIFNITTALFFIPISYYITKIVFTKIPPHFQSLN